MSSKASIKKENVKSLKKSVTKKRNNLFKYKVPKSIYEKALEEINKRENNVKVEIKLQCHHDFNNRFNASLPPNRIANFMEAAKQALEDRNFKILYEIINKAMDIKDLSVMQQMQEYLLIAINHDPLIKDKPKLIEDYVTRVKQLTDTSQKEEFLKTAHIFQAKHQDEKSKEKSEKIEEDDDDFDNVSEGSVDMKVFESIKNELGR